MNINIMYFASLKDDAKKTKETIQTNSTTINSLYEELNSRYNFTVTKKNLRVAQNEVYTSFESPIYENDTIVFIPPVAGG